MDYFLAIDIGASGGRHILGYLENKKMVCEEIYRFPNVLVKKDGFLCWDIDALFNEVIKGLKICADLKKAPVSVGIDTWGVDFILLDESMNRIGPAIAYRDRRTEGMDAIISKLISEETLYTRTGIQKLSFNSIYQLMAVKRHKDWLSRCKLMLMLPDYLHFKLCGVAKTEYTVATTTGLVSVLGKTWDDELLEICGYPRQIFAEIIPPGTRLGDLTSEIQKIVGFNCNAVTPASHDTASAVIAVPANSDNALYISSGTWSLMGVERLAPDCSKESMEKGFTNEGGYEFRYRYLKNIMGLWMIQRVKKELDDKYSFADLSEMASQTIFPSIVDVNEKRFLSPDNMIIAIKNACAESGQPVPAKPGELATVIYNSLAVCYRETAFELEKMTGNNYDTINIVGGGANAVYLNKLTERYTGKIVSAGPSEATAIGNISAQMISAGAFSDIKEARHYIRRSFVYS